MKEHNGISIKFKCIVDGCTAVLYSRGGLYKHCNQEHKCQFCNKVFMGPGEVDNHECKATTSAPVCHFCKKEFHMAQTCKCHIEEVCLVNPWSHGKEISLQMWYMWGLFFRQKQVVSTHWCIPQNGVISIHVRNVTVHSKQGIKLTNIQKYTTVKER